MNFLFIKNLRAKIEQEKGLGKIIFNINWLFAERIVFVVLTFAINTARGFKSKPNASLICGVKDASTKDCPRTHERV